MADKESTVVAAEDKGKEKDEEKKTNMEYRWMGKSGLRVSVLSFG
jgi:hypothetical protein